MSLYPSTSVCDGCGRAVKVGGQWYCGSCASILGVDPFRPPLEDDRARLKAAWAKTPERNDNA
jgi:hypothetical protein